MVLLACTVILLTLSGISPDCDGNEFGSSCQYLCRCSDGLSCNITSGECDGPCMPGWMGESCQFVNIAYRSPTRLKNTRQTNRLTDGDLYTNETIEFLDGDTIRVDLRFGYLIDSLTVYTNDYGSYQYSIFLKEESNQVENKTCYENISTAKKTFVRCRTRQYGRYVYLRFNGVVNHLIVYEVEINGGRNLAMSKSAFITKEKASREELSLTDGQPMWNLSGAGCNIYAGTYKFSVSLGRISTIVSVRLTVGSFDGNSSNLKIERALNSTVTTNIETRMKSMYNYIFVSLMHAAPGDEIFVITNKTIHLCEIEIFVFCINGMFGMDCENTCDCSTPINNAKCPHECRGGVIYSEFPRDSTTAVPASTPPSDSTTVVTPSLSSDTIPVEASTKKATDDDDTIVIVGAAAGGAVLLIILVIVIICLLCRRRRKRRKEPSATTPLYIIPLEEEYERENQTNTLNDPQSSSSIKSHKNTSPKIFENQAYVRYSDEEVNKPEADEPTVATNTSQVEHNGTGVNGVSSKKNKERERSTGSDGSSSNDIRVEDLSDFVNRRMASKIEFEQEFQTLPYGMQSSFSSAKANMHKNRYKGIYAYDHSRVHLAKERAEESEYINANYVQSFSQENIYIASQGATKENVDDFWRMIWQSRCGKVIMLTRVIEGGMEKCVQYWPEKERATCKYGNVLITLKKENVFTEFIIRKLKIAKDGEQRYLWQFQYTAWPDKSVPQYASSLVYFLRKIKITKENTPKCWIVHCSAGVGRTGTFIALDYLSEQAETNGSVDIFGCVKKLREQRVNMIQTLDQYIFLHSALIEALNCKSHAMSCAEFMKLYQDIYMKDTGEATEFVEKEFGKLEHIYCDSVKRFNGGKHPDNIEKNRNMDILPADLDRPYLSIEVEGCNNYINAVLLSGLRRKNQFVITQSPKENTVVDFWRLAFERKCGVIIDLNHDNKDVPFYPTDVSSSMQSGPFLLNVFDKATKSQWTVYNMYLIYKKETHKLTVFTTTFWKSDSPVPESMTPVRAFLEDVRSMYSFVTDKTIMITCLNGADRSGLLCALWLCLERLEVEQEVAIGQIVRQFRNTRHQFISSVICSVTSDWKVPIITTKANVIETNNVATIGLHIGLGELNVCLHSVIW